MTSLRDKTVFITGASRGIGAALALKFASEGANVVVTGKTVDPHPKLPGTIGEVAQACDAAGGRGLPVRMDLRDVGSIEAAVEATVDAFGGIDILVNNASAQTFTKTPDTAPKQFDLLMDVNIRGTFFAGQACLPWLEKASNPHILTIASPISLDPRWYAERLPRTISKMGMSMCVLGWAEELRERGIASNALWPRHAVATMAVKVFNPHIYDYCRRPEIMADAAHWIVTRPARNFTGRFLLDDEALREAGTDEAAIQAYWIHPSKRSRSSSFLDYDDRFTQGALDE